MVGRAFKVLIFFMEYYVLFMLRYTGAGNLFFFSCFLVSRIIVFICDFYVVFFCDFDKVIDGMGQSLGSLGTIEIIFTNGVMACSIPLPQLLFFIGFFWNCIFMENFG